MSSIPAAAFIDLGRTAKTITGMAAHAEYLLEGRGLVNLPRSIANERFVLNQVIDAAVASPAGFEGSIDVAKGVDALRRAVGLLDESHAALSLAIDAPVRPADVSRISPNLRAAAADVRRGHELLGGTRELPAYEGVGTGFVDRANLDIAPPDDPFVIGRGHHSTQGAIKRVFGMLGLDHVMGLHTSGLENIPEHGRVIIAPSHGSWGDMVHNAFGNHRDLRFMANAKVLEGKRGPVLSAAGAFPVSKGNAAAGMRTGRGVLDAEQAMVMYPGAMINQGHFYDTHRDGVAILALEMQSDIVVGASVGSRPAVYRGESRWQRPLVVMKFGTPISTRGIPKTEFNTLILREQVARAQAALMDEAQAEYDQLRNAPSLLRRFVA